MISQAQIREFREGEYIIKQGEVGEELFIILEGACEVVEDKNFLRSTSKDDKDKTSGKEEERAPNIVKLVTLREGHFFGEMSLMTVRAYATIIYYYYFSSFYSFVLCLSIDTMLQKCNSLIFVIDNCIFCHIFITLYICDTIQ